MFPLIASWCSFKDVLMVRASCKYMRKNFHFLPNEVPALLYAPGNRDALSSLMASFPAFQRYAICSRTSVKQDPTLRILSLLSPKKFTYAKRITTVDLSGMRLCYLKKTTGSNWITSLILANNRLGQEQPELLDSELEKYKKLEYLDLEQNSLAAIPAAIGLMPHLKTLILNTKQCWTQTNITERYS